MVDRTIAPGGSVAAGESHTVLRFRSLVATLVALAALAAPAGAGGIVRGQLWLSRKAMKQAHDARDPGVPAPASRRPAPVPVSATKPPPVRPLVLVPQPGVGDAVIYVEQVPDKVEQKFLPNPKKRQKRPALPRIVQVNQRYVPRVLAATAGDSVVFENLDRVYHNTFSVSLAKRFDLGKYPPGHVDTVRFGHRGVANLHCDIHPDEIGFVVVLPNHVFARPDSLGRFTLPKLPPGEYKVRTWHPRLGELTREVTMPKHGDVALELNY